MSVIVGGHATPALQPGRRQLEIIVATKAQTDIERLNSWVASFGSPHTSATSAASAGAQRLPDPAGRQNCEFKGPCSYAFPRATSPMKAGTST